MDTKQLVQGMVVLLVGLALTPIVNTFATAAQACSTGTEGTLLGLVPLLWVFVVIAIAIGLISYHKK